MKYGLTEENYELLKKKINCLHLEVGSSIVSNIIETFNTITPLEENNISDKAGEILKKFEQRIVELERDDMIHPSTQASLIRENKKLIVYFQGLSLSTPKQEITGEQPFEKKDLKCVQFFYGKECIYPHCKCDPVKAKQDGLAPLSEITEEDCLIIGKLFFEADSRKAKQIKKHHAFEVSHENCWKVLAEKKDGDTLDGVIIIDYRTGLIQLSESELKWDIGYEVFVHKAYKFIESKYIIPKYYTLD